MQDVYTIRWTYMPIRKKSAEIGNTYGEISTRNMYKSLPIPKTNRNQWTVYTKTVLTTTATTRRRR